MAIQDSITFWRGKVQDYLAQAAEYEALAETCKPSQRGPYLSQASQRRQDAQRAEANYDALMGQLAGEDFELYREFKESE